MKIYKSSGEHYIFYSATYIVQFSKRSFRELDKLNNCACIVDSAQKDYASENKREIKANKIISILQKDVVIKNKIILDIGSGHGHITNQFQKIAGNAIGIDKSLNLVRSSKKKHKNCEYICGDGSLLPIKKNSIDIIILNHIIEHTNHKDDLIKECNRILKEDGIIYLATPNKHFLIDPHTKIPFFGYMGKKLHDKYNIYNPTKKELIDLFRQYKFSYTYLTLDVISNLTDFEEYNAPLYKLISRCFKCIKYSAIKNFLTPTYIFIAKKENYDNSLFTKK